MLGVTIMELKVSPKVVSQSGEKRFENTGSSRSSNTDLQANKKGEKRGDVHSKAMTRRIKRKTCGR
jgi:hypothetical protein